LTAVSEAISALKAGKFVMVHDDKEREDEVDMVVAAEHVKPRHISIMRRRAGGLICLAIKNEISVKLGLTYMHDMLQRLSHITPLYSKLAYDKAPYGDRPSFSISINHHNTYTGVTDIDRALTINEMAEVCKNIDSTGLTDFATNFHAPGHVPILIASKNLQERAGHTELCVYLMDLAGLTPAVAICEMLDSYSYRSLSVEKAKKYASKSGIPILEANQLKNVQTSVTASRIS
jgi:3,4-dihydroxy 2-butanone 4-phosphate synthase